MELSTPSALESISAWILVVAYALSLGYEIWRATAKSGTSRHDSPRAFLVQDLWVYVLAAAVIALLLLGVPFAEWVGLGFAVVTIVVSIVVYNPRIMLEREPGLVDWFEDLVYTGLLFVVAALLLLEVLGATLST